MARHLLTFLLVLSCAFQAEAVRIESRSQLALDAALQSRLQSASYLAYKQQLTEEWPGWVEKSETIKLLRRETGKLLNHIKEETEEAVDSVKESVQEQIENFAAFVGEMKEKTQNAIDELKPKIKQAHADLKTAAEAAGKKAAAVRQGLKDLQAKLHEQRQQLVNQLLSSSLAKSIREINDEIVAKLEAAKQAMPERRARLQESAAKLKARLAAMRAAVCKKASEVADAISESATLLGEAIGEAKDKLVKAVGDPKRRHDLAVRIELLIVSMKEIKDAAVLSAQDMAERAVDTATDIGNAIGRAVVDAKNNAVEAWEGFKNSELGVAIATDYRNSKAYLAGKAEDAKAYLSEKATDAKEAVAAKVPAARAALAAAANAARAKLAALRNSVIEGADRSTSKLAEIKASLEARAAQLLEKAKGMGEDMGEAGKAWVQQTVADMRAGAAALATAAVNMASEAQARLQAMGADLCEKAGELQAKLADAAGAALADAAGAARERIEMELARVESKIEDLKEAVADARAKAAAALVEASERVAERIGEIKQKLSDMAEAMKESELGVAVATDYQNAKAHLSEKFKAKAAKAAVLAQLAHLKEQAAAIAAAASAYAADAKNCIREAFSGDDEEEDSEAEKDAAVADADVEKLEDEAEADEPGTSGTSSTAARS